MALHTSKMVEVSERQPYVSWTTTYYDFEEMKNMDLSPHTPPRPARGYDLVDFGITSTSLNDLIHLHCTESLCKFNSDTDELALQWHVMHLIKELIVLILTLQRIGCASFHLAFVIRVFQRDWGSTPSFLPMQSTSLHFLKMSCNTERLANQRPDDYLRCTSHGKNLNNQIIDSPGCVSPPDKTLGHSFPSYT